MQIVNENQPTLATAKVPSPSKGGNGKKASRQSIAKRSSATVAPTHTFLADHKIKNGKSDLEQRVSTDSDFVEIPLDDLTITDF